MSQDSFNLGRCVLYLSIYKERNNQALDALDDLQIDCRKVVSGKDEYPCLHTHDRVLRGIDEIKGYYNKR